MNFEYNKPKGQRIRKQFDSIDVLGQDRNWYQYSTGTWSDSEKPDYDVNSYHASHHDKCSYPGSLYPTVQDPFPKTEKALVRYFKRHPELQGKRVRVLTRWDGHFLEVQL